MRSCGLLFSWMRSLISDSVLPAGHSRQCFPKFSDRCLGTCLGTFHPPWFAWTQSAAILAVLNPLLGPCKTCPSHSASFCIFHGFLNRVVGIFDSTKLLPAPLTVWFALVGGLAWTLWSHRVCMTRIASFCTPPSVSRFVCAVVVRLSPWSVTFSTTL